MLGFGGANSCEAMVLPRPPRVVAADGARRRLKRGSMLLSALMGRTGLRLIGLVLFPMLLWDLSRAAYFRH